MIFTIQIVDLVKSYSGKRILENLSFSLLDSRIYALVGRNGTGKTTLLNSIVQASFKDSGAVQIDGIDQQQMQARQQMFYVPDNKEMFLNLTGEEYLRFIARLYEQKESASIEKIKCLSAAFHMEAHLNEYIANYSLGMKQKIYITAAFLSGAKNLILDEPFNGLDPESTAVLKCLLTEHRDDENMVLFSIHNLDLVSNFCDMIIFLDKHRQVSIRNNSNDFNELERVFFDKCVE